MAMALGRCPPRQTLLANGGVQMQLIGNAGHSYVLEASERHGGLDVD